MANQFSTSMTGLVSKNGSLLFFENENKSIQTLLLTINFISDNFNARDLGYNWTELYLPQASLSFDGSDAPKSKFKYVRPFTSTVDSNSLTFLSNVDMTGDRQSTIELTLNVTDCCRRK